MANALLQLILSVVIVLSVNTIAFRYNILIYSPNLNHKEKFKNKVINSGGSVLFIYFITINIFELQTMNLYYLLFIMSVFLVGILSDFKNISANIRLFIIFITTLVFVVLSDTLLLNLKFDVINNLLKNYFSISILFTTLCIVILINGINFIDGVHGLAIFYSITVLFLLNYFLNYVLGIEPHIESGVTLLPILFILFLFNINEKLFFGDSGSYLIGCILAIYIIRITNIDEYSYPYLYANFLIYPAFEVFFSIFRKISINKSPYGPDNKHLHQLLQDFFLRKNFNLTKAKVISGISINISVIIFSMIAISFYENKYFLILNIFTFAIFYCGLYILLNQNSKKN
jgi:UDP-N-acetylmuramyl pentapeptide phosphotransferase/UDP-N-acetylglucosamine-1-phosphate transferase